MNERQNSHDYSNNWTTLPISQQQSYRAFIKQIIRAIIHRSHTADKCSRERTPKQFSSEWSTHIYNQLINTLSVIRKYWGKMSNSFTSSEADWLQPQIELIMKQYQLSFALKNGFASDSQLVLKWFKQEMDEREQKEKIGSERESPRKMEKSWFQEKECKANKRQEQQQRATHATKLKQLEQKELNQQQYRQTKEFDQKQQQRREFYQKKQQYRERKEFHQQQQQRERKESHEKQYRQKEQKWTQKQRQLKGLKEMNERAHEFHNKRSSKSLQLNRLIINNPQSSVNIVHTIKIYRSQSQRLPCANNARLQNLIQPCQSLQRNQTTLSYNNIPQTGRLLQFIKKEPLRKNKGISVSLFPKRQKK